MAYNIEPFLRTNPCFSRKALTTFISSICKSNDPDKVVASIIKGRKRKDPPQRDFQELENCPSVYVTPAALADPTAPAWLPYILPMVASEGAILGFHTALCLFLGEPAPEKITFYAKSPGDWCKKIKTFPWAPEGDFRHTASPQPQGAEPFKTEARTHLFEAVVSDLKPGPSTMAGIPRWQLLSVKLAGCLIEVRVTAPEQTLVDVLDSKFRGTRSKSSLQPDDESGSPRAPMTENAAEDELKAPLSEAESSSMDSDFLGSWAKLSHWKRHLNFSILKVYLLAVGRPVTTSKTGYFLEGHFQEMGIKAVHLYGLKPPRPWKLGVPGSLNYRWLLRIPSALRHKGPPESHGQFRPRLKGDVQLEDLDLLEILSQEFGRYMPRFDRFRPGQESLILQVLAGQDAFGVLPTGVGKSLTFQFPSLLLNGLTLVISPLVALMNDQVRKATALGLNALTLPSKRDNEARMACIRAIEDGSLNLLFISPEALFPLIVSFEHLRAAVVQIVVDEAHTLLTWGRDFRYAMQDLKRLRALWPNVPILALTATATPREREEIMSFLGFRSNTEPYVGTTYRKCLFLYTQNISGGFEAKFAALIEFLDKYSGLGNGNNCGIIYCPTKPEAEKVALALYQYFEGLSLEEIKSKPEKNISSKNKKACNKIKKEDGADSAHGQSTFCLPETSRVQCYHSGLQDACKTQALRMFIELPDTILVGTVAVGMGIDKNKVRFVVNFGPPSSINEYVQQIGRAGRDGEDSECLVLHSYQDWEIWTGRLDSAAKKLKNKIETIDQHKYFKEISRLNQRREDLANLRKLFISPKCIHQAIGDHFGETIVQCKTHCGICQDPYSHRDSRRAYLQNFGITPESEPNPNWNILPEEVGEYPFHQRPIEG